MKLAIILISVFSLQTVLTLLAVWVGWRMGRRSRE
jgi:hypothetical protein